MSKIYYFLLAILGAASVFLFGELFYEVPKYLGIALATFGLLGMFDWTCEKGKVCKI